MLRLPHFAVHRPGSVAEALQILATAPHARPLAGGTDLLVAMKHGHHKEADLVSLAGLGLSGIERSDSAITVGAGTSLWDLMRWAWPGALGVVAEAVRAVAAPPLQSRATVGGNVCLDTRCWFFNQSAFWRSGRPACLKAGGDRCHVVPGGSDCHAVSQADLPPVLIACGAQAEIAGPDGSREVPVEGLFSGDGRRPHTLSSAELLLRLRVPLPPPGAGAAYEKLRMRRALDFAAASAAVYLERRDGGCARARVVLGGLGTSPLRVPEAEAALEGTELDPRALAEAAEAAVAAARPVKNTDLTPAYRRKMAGVLVRRAALRAWTRAAGEES
ncbi:FAD binding domain-containing protein [Deferrisoma camini]|uniref:FAD binding domain-containing protein n=1 Tax=Deferrisoma camini TaxID=1035120 RepID=UPI00046D6148|nr:FAD binding domain-containing protein [Deferrisoma camini]